MAVSHIFSNAIADFTGTFTGFNSQGSTTTIAATNIVRPSDWNSAHNQFYTFTGNTTGNSTASGTNVIFAGSGGVSVGGSTGSVVISGPPGYTNSSFVNIQMNNTTGLTFNGASVSHCVAFNLPEPHSVSFIRIPCIMSTNSTTVSTLASSANASAEVYSTFNAVIYSLGTGASSQSLISVASGSAGFTLRNSISVAANGTQYSVTQAFSAQAQGGGTTRTTQYSISNTNYSFSTNTIATEFSSNRFIDINFANSLQAGAYWLVAGMSTSSNTNSTRFSGATACGAYYQSHIACNQGISSSAFGVMGSTNSTSGAYFGGGSFSTAGGGTTSIFPLSAISSSVSYPQLHFQMLRSV